MRPGAIYLGLAILAIVNGVLLRPLSYREPDRIANLWVDFGVGAQSLPAMSPGDFRDYQQRAQSFSSVAAGSGGQIIGATGALTGTGGEPERVDVSPVTANFFTLLGVDPLHGRHFTEEEEKPGDPSVVGNVKAADPMTFATMVAVLMAAALAGCYIPAHRATRVNPIVALKTD